MKNFLVCSLFCLVLLISCNKQQDTKYNETVNLIKDCYSNVASHNNDKDYWMWSKETNNCLKCNQKLLRNIEFIHNRMEGDSFEEGKVIVETCKNEKCKYFAVYQIPLHKVLSEDEYKEIKSICLYEGKYINLDDVLLENSFEKDSEEEK